MSASPRAATLGSLGKASEELDQLEACSAESVAISGVSHSSRTQGGCAAFEALQYPGLAQPVYDGICHLLQRGHRLLEACSLDSHQPAGQPVHWSQQTVQQSAAPQICACSYAQTWREVRPCKLQASTIAPRQPTRTAWTGPSWAVGQALAYRAPAQTALACISKKTQSTDSHAADSRRDVQSGSDSLASSSCDEDTQAQHQRA